MKRILSTGCLILCLIALISVSSAWAESDVVAKPENTITEGGLGLVSLLASIPYGVIKIGYAAVGALAGGLNYLEGKKEPAEAIWHSSLDGTYILTPDHLRGKTPIKFFGDVDPGRDAVPPGEEGRSAAAR